MRRVIWMALVVGSLALVGCTSDTSDGDGGNNGDTNNGAVNNGAVNNGDTNNGDTNNGADNNGDTNNGDTNNGAVNNGDTNNGDANNGDTNNGDVNNGVDGACAEACTTIVACPGLADTCDADFLADFEAGCISEGCLDSEFSASITALASTSCAEIEPVVFEEFGLSVYCGDDSEREAVDTQIASNKEGCLADCSKDVECNGEDAFPMDECMAYCEDIESFWSSFNADTTLVGCLEAEATVIACVNGSSCEDYNLYYNTEEPPFPCDEEYSAFAEACADYFQ